MTRDVVVLGWWSRAQARISYVEILRSLGFDLATAKAGLDQNLHDGSVTVIPVAPPRDADAIAGMILDIGAEARVLSGHAGEGGDPNAQQELEDIERAVLEFRARDIQGWKARAAAAAELVPHLRPKPANR